MVLFTAGGMEHRSPGLFSPSEANSVRSSTGVHCSPLFSSPGKEASVAFCSYLSLSHFPQHDDLSIIEVLDHLMEVFSSFHIIKKLGTPNLIILLAELSKFLELLQTS